MEAGDSLDVSFRKSNKIPQNKSISYLSGAAIGGNATLANTIIANGKIGEDLPHWDSQNGFRKILSSPNLSDSETPPPSSSFTDVQMAGGAAGEDRVQAVCSDKNGWLFCGVYDGFNGRDAADFLAGTFFQAVSILMGTVDWERGDVSYQQEVVSSLQNALKQAENEYLNMVETEMGSRPDLVSIGSCVLVGLLRGLDLFVLNLGDSRAENLVKRAATCAGFSEGELLNIPAGRRRMYHDDVTVIVVVFGSKQRTSKASTHLDQVR